LVTNEVRVTGYCHHPAQLVGSPNIFRVKKGYPSLFRTP